MSELMQADDTNQVFKSETQNFSDLTNLLFATGRFSRLSYIAWLALWSFMFQLIDYGIKYTAETNSAAPVVGIIIFSAYLAIFAFFIYILVMITVRRCHDVNIGGLNSGWLILPVANSVFVIYLMLKRGSEGSNKYGPSRTTFIWEKVLGYIGAIAVSLMLLIIIVALIWSLVDHDFRQTIGWSELLF